MIKPKLSPEGQYLLSKIEEVKAAVTIQPALQREYYRAPEVCKLLGISRSKFEQFKKSGLFQTHKVGGMVYVAASELDRLLPKIR